MYRPDTGFGGKSLILTIQGLGTSYLEYYTGRVQKKQDYWMNTAEFDRSH
jgi:hypothetical protein